ASACACATVSSTLMPTSTSSPAPISPTTDPSTATLAELTRWMTARMLAVSRAGFRPNFVRGRPYGPPVRLLHTSDWHLGRSLHRADLRDAQAGFLDHLVDVVRAERVDVVLVAGDVYD